MNKVYIQRVAYGDSQELIEFNLENKNYHRPWVSPFTDQAGFQSWFSRCLTAAVVSLVVREETSRKVAGIININEIVAGALQSGFLGFYGSSKMAGQGLMTEGLKLAIKYAFEQLGLHRLEANIQPDNKASIGLVRRAGFQKEGFSPKYLFIDGAWRDHERWAIIAEK
ncbi:GNAT family N-acetyltransferase [Advenella mimigardefordensis]|uniref:Putative acetyltransferase n=1 Tax=Advenella mimigardefordensis (strain DSM 17166 / LMG 22922 / DPN7) TaxID=1247726 RepID=W0P9M5_ADVMD|nr:GNAT family N-acetyltransferase [Advenella mimigardefordensis]AHG62125.1 putative acetyltransferase [Advenella mimigardefordensis DPN7]